MPAEIDARPSLTAEPERFSDAAWDLLIASQEQARRWRHDQMDVEHTLQVLQRSPLRRLDRAAAAESGCAARSARRLLRRAARRQRPSAVHRRGAGGSAGAGRSPACRLGIAADRCAPSAAGPAGGAPHRCGAAARAGPQRRAPAAGPAGRGCRRPAICRSAAPGRCRQRLGFRLDRCRAASRPSRRCHSHHRP